jgi:antitoxin ParD1/3/4
MATMNVSIPDAMKDWVERQSGDGRYSNASDYVRDLIRRDQARQEAIAVLQAAIDEGLASGPSRPFDAAAFKLRMRERQLVR